MRTKCKVHCTEQSTLQLPTYGCTTPHHNSTILQDGQMWIVGPLKWWKTCRFEPLPASCPGSLVIECLPRALVSSNPTQGSSFSFGKNSCPGCTSVACLCFALTILMLMTQACRHNVLSCGQSTPYHSISTWL